MVEEKTSRPKFVSVFDCTLRLRPSNIGDNDLAIIDCIEEVSPETSQPRIDVYV